MNLKHSSFADAGTFEKERLVLKAHAEVEIGNYAVFCSGVSDGKATAGHKTAYWFPDEKVKAGDLVVLYTKTGTDSKKKLESGVTAHFFYWGLKNAIWGNSNNTAVLLRVAEWSHRVASNTVRSS